MKKLALFDIDGTLVRCGKAPRRAIVLAMQNIYGIGRSDETYSFSGKTDPQIITELMRNAGVDEVTIEDRMSDVIGLYVAELDRTLRGDDIQVLAGVRELLDVLARSPDIKMGLLTGNVEPGARIKLNRAGIGHFFFNGFPVGAFGSDARDRFDLPEIAIRRAREVLGHDFQSKDVVIVGDSPNDILCGKHLNVLSVAIATGWHSSEELKPFKPDFLFDSLTPPENIVAAIMAG